MPLFAVENLVHAYNHKPVLQIEQMEIASGSITGLIGPNGSGKSTLLRLLAFVERPLQGDIRLEGQQVRPFDPRARQVTLLPQTPYLLKRSVFHNVAYGLMVRGQRRNLQSKVWQALEMVGLAPGEFAARDWDELSGGEAQRVALAARLVLSPKVLLLDEPTASVDAASAQLIKEASLQARQKWNTTLVIASHDWLWLSEVCDDIRHLFRGHLLGKGPASLIFGPWKPAGDGQVEKILPDGQRLKAAGRPVDLETGVAVLDPFELSLGSRPPRVSADLCWVRGVLAQIGIEKGSDRLLATVVAGSVRFAVSLSQKDRPVLDGYIPGKTVWLGYDPRQVKWY